MSGDGIEVARLNWGPGHLSGPTDTSWFKLIELPNGDLSIIRYDMGPETEACFGHYDFEQSISIAAADRAQFTAMRLAHFFDGAAPLNWDEFLAACKDWSVPFGESERAVT